MTAAATRLPYGLIVIAGCMIAMLTFGPRSAMGFFQQPIITANNWGRDSFAFALALQNLIWGIGQPFMGAMADKFGTVRVLITGLALYSAGLVLMAFSSTPLTFNLTAGVLIGFGLSGCSFNIVLAAFGKILPPEKRSMAFGFGTAAGSFGQFLFSPLGVALIEYQGWQTALMIFAGLMLLAVPLSFSLAVPPTVKSSTDIKNEDLPIQNVSAALKEAFRHPSYIFLVTGFFTCGFQVGFITVHLPAYLRDAGLTPAIGAWTLAMIGICNIFGSLFAGWLCNHVPKRMILSGIYILRCVITLALLAAIPFAAKPINLLGLETTYGVVTALLFGAFTGFLWLSTVPPTISLVGVMFGQGYVSMLYGFAFFSHQVGAFLGVWLGGIVFEMTRSYLLVWQLSIALGLASALINLPIREKAIKRPSNMSYAAI
jgi:MFS family permease